MYGLPDSVVVGTAKRINRYIDRKTKADGAWPRMMDSLYERYLEKKQAKQERKALEKKHRISFSD